MRKWRRIRFTLPWVLIAGGGLLVLQGARDLFESRWGQYDAAREFTASATPLKIEPVYRPHAGDTVAKLIIPRLDTELYVVEGTDAADLRRGPGHLTGTAMPGEAGNCVIAGHRDTHFRILREIRRGDSIVIERDGRRFVYRVNSLAVVSPADTSSLRPAPGTLHLITCYPFSYIGSAPKRMVVEARLAAN